MFQTVLLSFVLYSNLEWLTTHFWLSKEQLTLLYLYCYFSKGFKYFFHHLNLTSYLHTSFNVMNKLQVLLLVSVFSFISCLPSLSLSWLFLPCCSSCLSSPRPPLPVSFYPLFNLTLRFVLSLLQSQRLSTSRLWAVSPVDLRSN